MSAKAAVSKVSQGGRWTKLCWSVMISPEGSPSDLHGKRQKPGVSHQAEGCAEREMVWVVLDGGAERVREGPG